jgi:hypothetical protein
MIDDLHRGNKPVSSPGNCFQKPRILSGVAKRNSELVDGGIQPAVKISEYAVRPKHFAELFPRNHLTRSLYEQTQQPKWLILEADFVAFLVKLFFAVVEFIQPKANSAR